jgi:phospho-N-acetylmuramoyl-pentapeptide-transferase
MATPLVKFTHHDQTTILLVAFGMSFVLTLALGWVFIRIMRSRGIGQYINPDGPASHVSKTGTVTAGGLFFMTGATAISWVMTGFSSRFSVLPIAGMWLFGMIGFIDDLAKILKRDSIGLSSLNKLALQLVAAFLLVFMVMGTASGSIGSLTGKTLLTIGMWYIPFAACFFIAYANAVNITDGLDGLAGLTALPVLVFIILLATFAVRTDSVDVTAAYPLAVCAASCGGAVLAFLWYNSPKASVFMGDCGSHAIGAFIATSALLLKAELLVTIASLVFVVECLSSLLQIISIRIFKKKIFLMAPLHHHYEKQGIGETNITMRMAIISLVATTAAGLLAVVG